MPLKNPPFAPMNSAEDPETRTPDNPSTTIETRPPAAPPTWIRSEDGLAIWLGWIVLLTSLLAVYLARPLHQSETVEQIERLSRQIGQWERQSAELTGEAQAAHQAQTQEASAELDSLRKSLVVNPLKPWIKQPESWTGNPLAAFVDKSRQTLLPGIGAVFVISLLLFGLGARAQGQRFAAFAGGFTFVFLVALLAYVLAGQAVIKHYNLEYALWALVVGLLISNTVGMPAWVRPGVRVEFYIKTGLVILGAEVLFSQLLALGVPGVFVSWVVTPIVLVATYLFGQYVLRIPSKSLNMVISAEMSVCGVSAAIATAAACRAKKEELSLAIGLSLTFTVVMMVVLPLVIQALGIGPVLGGAWIGGTIDSTGAVAAAGKFLGDAAMRVAITIKMIQNILIGATAFGVAVYWVLFVDRSAEGARPSVFEIWRRFPKFVLGFLAASLLFSWIYVGGVAGQATVDAATDVTKAFRNWFFCLAFVSIGLDTNFRALSQQLQGGKPLVLYVCGQSLNLCLTLLMAWLMFVKVFPHASAVLSQ